ncbi:hypothetical protein CPB83DRAFT_844552 [Crepidotus variabilis]|uniref:LsmAD domain-containing protein n=1 Tax=Crepidotus variabilis TaxID=179855 RepID=A0A9P6JVE2_9AGAR|nr:hypothetical protein CPB83DRAFT_844552 [Crepidotus variabilis]
MASQSRQNKGGRKPEPTQQRRTAAWGPGARASQTYSPGPTRQQQTASPASPSSFPPLAPTNGARPDNPQIRILQALSGLTGTTITLLTKPGIRWEGEIASAITEGDASGVTLKDARDIGNRGAPLQPSVFIPASNIDSYTSGPADASRPSNGDSFRTDVDITLQKKGLGGRERELQAWTPSSDAPSATSGTIAGGLGDEDTFGQGANGNNTSWDQFTANEQLFGVKASFDEDVYTTKLDRNAPDFKERERKAQKIANEIIGATTNNPHIAEERGLVVDDSGVNEEDKYGAVVRGQNAYVPPGARKTVTSPPATQTTHPTPDGAAASNPEIPKVSVNGPDGTPKAPISPTPAPNKPPADPLPAFRDFVTNEKQRLTQKRQALVKNEMDKRMAELVKFSQSFKLNKPIPDDLVPILAKDEEKQKLIKEKAKTDAISSHARAIGPSTPATASRGVAVAGAKISKPVPTSMKPNAGTTMAASNGVGGGSSAVASGGATPAIAANKSASATPTPAAAKDSASKKIPMVIQGIPPFRGGKGKANASTSSPSANAPSTPSAATNGSSSNANANANRSNASASPAGGVSPNNSNSAHNAAARLNVNASSFRPNPKATASPKPSPATASNVSSPKPKDAQAPTQPNPFFGARPIKKGTPVHVKDDFNPFKHNKVVEASQVSALWPYSGKRYMQAFPPIHPPTQQPHQPMPQPAVQAPPPPSYEEDSAAQAAAARGYVYAYPPYGYPPPHMMPGMAPPGPHGGYMPGPYMQPMPYPPGMPPNAMYSPGMGQMPPPGHYMPPPPPGAYGAPPPPNGAGPRGSMPPTPMPSHAHPYYHQSPQMPHAYPMMMPPPNMAAGGAPPHGYEGAPAPPVQMGGHA